MRLEEANPLVADMLEAASRRATPRHYLGMSQIGDRCPRKIWYGFRGYTPRSPDGRLQMIFSLGDRVEEEVIRWLREAGYAVEGQQDAFEAVGGYFRGHCDGYIDGVTQRRHVLEIKSASDARWKAFRSSGIPQVAPVYYAQLQCYMGYSGLDRGLWVVMNKNDCSIYTETLHFLRSDFEAIEARARRIITSNMEPPRAYGEGARECSWCDYQGHCWRRPYVQSAPTCGTCASCECRRDPDPGFWCLCHDRRIETWGASCPQWFFRDMVDQVPF